MKHIRHIFATNGPPGAQSAIRPHRTPHSRNDPLRTTDPLPELSASLRRAVPGGVRDEPADRLAVAHDASHFILTPRAVVTPRTTEQVASLLRGSAHFSVGLTFRSGGTSLSGQAVTDGVIVDTRRHFGRIEVLDEGARVKVGPGATLRQVNLRLAPYGRKLGPDPASETACTIGGVVANNSSGMACGIQDNSYRTLDSMVFVLPSGTTIDTGLPDANQRLQDSEPTLYAGLIALRDRLRASPSSVAEVKRQYTIKNTMGYGLNAFLDYDVPVHILSHLIIGSEGTLAFVAEVTFRTVPLMPHAASALLVFPDLATGMGHLSELVAHGPTTVELLDSASLRIAQKSLRPSSPIHGITIADHAGFLVEYQANSTAELADLVTDADRLISCFSLSMSCHFTVDTDERADLWHMRKGLYATVASGRPAGSSVLLEDIAVPIAAVSDTCGELVSLFDRYDYDRNIVFGHAKNGNLHFTLNEWLTDTTAPPRYQAFTEDLVDLVLAHGGSLKAEHGTGRMMAPFVRRQFGDELYQIMVELKRLCDPTGLLNPGVIITDDLSIHTRNFKITPESDPEVDRCVECGYCEPVCPSRNLTLTPRQRIVLRREMVRAATAGDDTLFDHLRHRFVYDGISTCAVDGMCQTACPVEIDTGELVRRLRSENIGRGEEWIWEQAARHWAAVTHVSRLALSTAAHIPAPIVVRTLAAGRTALGSDRVPLWGPDLPGGGEARRAHRSLRPNAVYFPSCMGSVFGQSATAGGVRAAFAELCERGGVELRVPQGIENACCGTPWKSKGFRRGYEIMSTTLAQLLNEATEGGRLPVVSDASSCTEGLGTVAAEHGIHVIDSVTFVRDYVLGRVEVKTRLASLVLHPTCASTRLGVIDDMIALAHEISEDVVVPDAWGCCAFAGDRGLLHPELTRSATASEADAVDRSRLRAAHVSCNRPCEIAMTRATGIEYRHIIELVNETTR